MPSAEGPAPTVAELHAYSLGKLAPAEADRVEGYLAAHPECCGLLEEAPDDEVVRHLRGAGALPEVRLPPRATNVLSGGETLPAPAPVFSSAPASPGADWPTALADHPRYRLIRKLGEGGMGAVFLAEHRLLHRLVAVKVIQPRWMGQPQAVERFRREAQAAAGLDHPNIVRAHDAEEAGGSHFLVMEYVEGVSLDRWLAEHGPLPAAEACAYGRQAAVGLQYAHEKGMIHRDLKPHNLMRTPEGTVKILDFGLARLACEPEGFRPLTDLGAVMGTADYMAPEQGQDSRTADIRADIYSLGCTLYHLLAGRPPFPEGTAVGKILKHSLEQPEALARCRPDLPAGLARVVEKMMAKRPADRYATPAEVADALEPFTQPGVLSRTDSRGASAPRRRALVLGGSLVLVAVLGVTAAVLYRPWTVERVAGPERLEPAPAGAPPVPALFCTLTFPEGSFADQFHFSADKRRLLGSGLFRGGRVTSVWDIETGKVLCTLAPITSKVWHNARFFPGGEEFLLQADNTLSRWSVATGQQVADYPPLPDGYHAEYLELSPDGRYLATVYPGHFEKVNGRDLGLDNRISVRELSAKQPFWIEPEHARSILCYAFKFSPDSSRFVTVDSSLTHGALRVWDTATGTVAARLPADVGFTGYVNWSADGRRLFAVYNDPETKQAGFGTWEVATGKQVAAVNYGLPPEGSDKVVIPVGGRWFATVHLGTGVVNVWDSRTGKPVETLALPGLTLLSPTASADGTLLAVANRQEVRLYRFREP
jgi:hypothetical protein